MQLWMIVVLICLATATVGAAVYILNEDHWREKSRHEFFAEVETGMNTKADGVISLALPTSEIAAFNKAKKLMHDQYFPDEPLNANFDDDEQHHHDTSDEASSDDEETEPPAAASSDEPWQRKLQQDAKATLKSLLVKRAMAGIPVVRQFLSEWTARTRLNRMQLMNQHHWGKIEKYSESLEEELNTIRGEAEAIQEGWGKSDRIFYDANIFYQHMTIKQQKEKEIAAKETSMAVREREEKQTLEKERKIAERMMAALIQKESGSNKKSVAAATAKQQESLAVGGDPTTTSGNENAAAPNGSKKRR